MTIDSLIGADLVTPDGKLRRVDAQQNADLFWAMRGGGGNFGVVTSFEFRLHELPAKLVGGDLVYPIEQARAVLDFVAEYSARAPDELWLDPVLECDAQGTRQLMLNLCHCGTARAAQQGRRGAAQNRQADARQRGRSPVRDAAVGTRR